MEWNRAWISDARVFLEDTSENVPRVVHDDIDVSVDRDSLGSDRMELAQRSRDIEFESSSTLLLQLGKLRKGASTGGRDDFISTR